MTLERDLLLARPWERPGRTLWLAVDLLGGDRILEIGGPDRIPPESPGAIVVAAGGDTCEALSGGGLRITEDILWSLVDPGCPNAGQALPLEADRLAMETNLRTTARRFSGRLAWWRGLDQELRDWCRRTMAGWTPSLDPLWDWLESAPIPPAPDPVVDQAQPTGAPGTSRLPAPDPDEIYRWLGAEEGLGTCYGAGFRPRPEQAEMGREVASALIDGEPLLLEAGTGVGKTLGYLVPLLSLVTTRETRAVVSTHTRALQTQILDQDLPRLKHLLGDRRFSLLMGRRNYLCLRQRQAFGTRPLEDFRDGLQAVAFRLWLTCTTEGRRHEIGDHPLLSGRTAELFDGAELCLPGLCYEGDRCFVQKARRRARESDILVVNHSLLLADRRQGGTLLGEVDHLVVDEAHRLPAAALDAYAVAVGVWRFNEIGEMLGRTRGVMPERALLAAERLEGLGKEGTAAAGACRNFGEASVRAVGSCDSWWRQVADWADEGLGGGDRAGRVRIRDKDEAFGPLRRENGIVLEELAEAVAALGVLAARTESLEDPGPVLQDDLAMLAQAGAMFRALHRDIEFLVGDADEDWVTWLEPGPKRGVRRLGATLLEAGGVLREQWLESNLRPVVTSATLAVGEDFTHMLSELGLTRRRPSARTVTCPSPFDYHEQARVLVPARFPDPSAPGFNRAVGEVLRELVWRTGRKTMGLFTSYRAIREAAEVLTESPGASESGAPAILIQSPRGDAGSLLHQFRRRERAVLLGTTTFWEGVDFPGETLEILVVTKLPFQVPNDPWVEARCDRLAAQGENPFTAFMVRDAVLRLRQGFGRLIRRASDRGVVVILDNRLHTKNYGTTFLSALPTMPVTFGDTADLLVRTEDFFSGR